MTRLLRRLRYLLQRDRHERELDDELRFHLEMKQQDLESRGLDRAAAATAARRAMGNLPLTREHVRDVWIAPWLQSVVQDVRYACPPCRACLRRPRASPSQSGPHRSNISAFPTRAGGGLVDVCGGFVAPRAIIRPLSRSGQPRTVEPWP